MDTLDDILLDAEDKMDKSTEFLQQELGGLRTGKASPALVENIMVDYCGSHTRLREIANLSTPEPRLLVVNPFDPTSLGAIEKAILAANVGITPVSDGRLVRIPVPELSEERRQDMVKVARRLSEDSRVAVRNIRRDANESIKNLQKEGGATEDERDAALDEVQKSTDSHVARIDELLAHKEKEMMEV